MSNMLCDMCWTDWTEIGTIGDLIVAIPATGTGDVDGVAACAVIVDEPGHRGDHVARYVTVPTPDPFVAWEASHDDGDDMTDQDSAATAAWHDLADIDRGVDAAHLGIRGSWALVEAARDAGWTQSDDGDVEYWLRHQTGLLIEAAQQRTSA